jgi:serine phosphatase RsbU (regulator of sigma subunit)
VCEIEEGRWRFAIGDVCGKGPDAVAVTGLTRHAMRILAREGTMFRPFSTGSTRCSSAKVPGCIRHHDLRELLPAQGGGATISVACAGHPPALALRSAGGVQAAAKAQPLLGVLDQVTFRADSMRLSPGAVLLCVIDGVTERRAFGRLPDDDGGLSSLLGECSALSAGAIAARIRRAANKVESGPPADDQALIVFRGI